MRPISSVKDLAVAHLVGTIHPICGILQDYAIHLLTA